MTVTPADLAAFKAIFGMDDSHIDADGDDARVLQALARHYQAGIEEGKRLAAEQASRDESAAGEVVASDGLVEQVVKALKAAFVAGRCSVSKPSPTAGPIGYSSLVYGPWPSDDSFRDQAITAITTSATASQIAAGERDMKTVPRQATLHQIESMTIIAECMLQAVNKIDVALIYATGVEAADAIERNEPGESA
jgi:hypothetical protein